MIFRTFLSKCNTILSGSRVNYGLNPVCALNYGAKITRALLYFGIEEIRNLYEDGTIQNVSGVTHTLKMRNCSSLDVNKTDLYKPFPDEQKRATSFDIIFFKIPEKWDCGVGFDNETDFWLNGNASISKDGSNWRYAYNGKRWREYDGEGAQDGIYSADELGKELIKYNNGEESIIITTQHFDYGNEDVNIDITDYIQSLVFGEEENNGIAMAFSPMLEESESEETNYVGFFTNKTNTFFQPYVETRYSEQILDDRYSFYLGKENRLYFYAFLAGVPHNLDTLPTCTINDVEMPVFCQTKGVYYALVTIEDSNLENTIQYDVWSDIVMNGIEMDNEEFEFVVLPKKDYYQFKEILPNIKKQIYPVAYGINDAETIRRGDIREIDVVFKVPYTKTDYLLIKNAEYKLYVKNGNKTVDVFDWDYINISKNLNFFMIDTNSLLPGDYHIDIKAEIGREKKIFKDVIRFTIESNSTNQKL